MTTPNDEICTHPATASGDGAPRPRNSGEWFAASLQAIRAHHWAKNGIVFFPLLFAMRFADPGAWLAAGLAFCAFCAAASGTYLANDLRDRKADQNHPTKRLRPIASGRLPAGLAVVELVVLEAAALLLALAVGPAFVGVIVAYLLLQVAYNAQLKHRMLLDAIALACGFVLRAMGGAVAIHVEISPWLIICTFALCLFLGFCKRHCEILTIGDRDSAARHRNTLAGYTPQLLNHLITLSATVAVISFLLYATNERTLHQFGTDYFVYTIPLVVYGVCRVAMLSMQGRYEGPTELLLRDRPVQIAAAAWMGLAVVIVVYGRAIQHWLAGSM